MCTEVWGGRVGGADVLTGNWCHYSWMLEPQGSPCTLLADVRASGILQHQVAGSPDCWGSYWSYLTHCDFLGCISAIGVTPAGELTTNAVLLNQSAASLHACMLGGLHGSFSLYTSQPLWHRMPLRATGGRSCLRKSARGGSVGRGRPHHAFKSSFFGEERFWSSDEILTPLCDVAVPRDL